MEVGELSWAIGQPWSILWPKVRKLEERKNAGRALSPKEQKALLGGLKDRRTPHLPTLIPLLLLTGMRAGEALSLTWAQVDLMGKTLTVGRAKTANGTGRVIPINDDLASILAAHRAWFVKEFGEPAPYHHLFPWGKPVPSDPVRHDTDITWGGDHCGRIQRSLAAFTTFGIPSPPGLARTASLGPRCSLTGHMSRSMLERYSHIRMTAKRDAVGGATLSQGYSLWKSL